MAEAARRSDEPAMVGQFLDLGTARLAQSRLEAEGIRTHLADENFGTAQPWNDVLVGGYRLMVAGADAEAARDLLGELERARAAATDECPKCGSKEVREGAAGRRFAFLSIFLLNLPLGRTTKKFRCAACGHVWRG